MHYPSDTYYAREAVTQLCVPVRFVRCSLYLRQYEDKIRCHRNFKKISVWYLIVFVLCYKRVNKKFLRFSGDDSTHSKLQILMTT